ncbi:Na+/H+ antiporter NhaC family protein [Paraglaciecola sp. MB-3u-78]|jgi:Na+/H+ antiporter NhaC|uniref:Na+/H+ antiporter NhaC family protein n=1 Tax=Paraglaciecola sp. MB-3u-78 TaxID=2058332 RepID=UPI000C333F46|nr:Na+/H+ antiporter NhaC family protein [Paraglaciecola sp. MB-3u-78]PKH00138.1 transporter [Paraglaciecola sp. MB-3u-78]
MEVTDYIGPLSLVPAAVAVILAFTTRNTVFSLAVACLVGVLVAGEGLLGFPKLLVGALGTESFSWILLLEFFIGILLAFFQRTGAIANFSLFIERRKMNRKRVQLISWFMGMFVYFSDYFSPLFVGSTMRGLADRYKISREKLAYICDSTSAPISILVPFTGWAVFVAGLTIGMGPVADAGDGMLFFMAAIPFNIYPILTVIMVGLIASGTIPDFGPMKTAERRAMEEGKPVRDGGQPLMADELTGIKPIEGIRTSLFWNFVFPVFLVIGFALISVILTSSAKPLEAFMLAVFALAIIMRIQGVPLEEITSTAMSGIKGIMPAVVILAFAYALNDLSAALNTADYIVSVTETWLTPSVLPVLVFIISGIVAFSTGSSWGTYAIMIPISVPLAFSFSGGEMSTLVYATLGATAGGGVFGDHCSPLSDTSILASTGAASDHIDHVKTQLPYSLLVGVISVLAYLWLGMSL